MKQPINRHDSYKDQFRAMFVTNCTVKQDQILRYPLEEDDLFHPVSCSECQTEIAVFDKNEVYHFFNVISDLP